MGMVTRILLFFTLFFSSCFLYKDQVIGLERQVYSGNELRLDGYYYHIDTMPKEDMIFLEFFYENGIFSKGFGGELRHIEYLLDDFRNYSYAETIKNSKTGWGLFIIRDDEIVYECWEPSNGDGLITVEYYGDILNDTTYVINRIFVDYTNSFYEKNDTFHFKQFDYKPETTEKWFTEEK